MCGDNAAIRLCMEITKVPNQFVDGGNIYDVTNAFGGLTLSSDNYESEIRDIAVLPDRDRKMGEHLKRQKQFALMGELGKFAWCARIPRHDSWRDASISAQTFESAGQVI